MRSRINPAGDHIWLYIDYSTDYGETFITYFHDLDSTITGIKKLNMQNYELKNYPNPFNYETKIKISEDYKCTYSFLQIIDISGKIIRKFTVHNKDYILWDGTDINGNKINSGIYFYYITGNNIMTPLNKIVFINQNQ
jgi:flagellar hook assembly protein FlgD